MTVSDSGIRSVVPPLVAEIVVEYTPPVTPLAAVSVRVLFPDPGATRLAGLNAAVTPVGSPVTEKATAALKPPLIATFIDKLLVERAATESVLAESVAWNAGVAADASLQCPTRTEAFTEPRPVV